MTSSLQTPLLTSFVAFNKIIDFFSPGVSDVSRYQEVLVDSAGKYRVNCSMSSTAGGWFYLYIDGEIFAETRAWQNGTSASFGLTEQALSNLKGKLSCEFGENQFNDTIRQTQGEPRGNEGRRDSEGGGGDVPSR